MTTSKHSCFESKELIISGFKFFLPKRFQSIHAEILDA